MIQVAEDPPPPPLVERLAELTDQVRELERGVAALQARIALLGSR